jgi:predicted MFS family arabinose efflux permease
VTLPALLFALVGGALADMFNRRRVLPAAQAVMLIAAGSLLAAQGLGLMTPWLLIGLTFAVNVGTALRMPVQSALANDLVQRAEVPAAVAVTGIGANLGRSLGPGIGGALIAAAGVAFAFAASMACIAGAILTSAGWRSPAAHDGMRHTHMGRAIVEGLAHAVVQLLAPAPLRGRLIALNLMTIYSGMGLGSAFWGMAADAFGLRGALLTAAAALAANLLLALWVPYRS